MCHLIGLRTVNKLMFIQANTNAFLISFTTRIKKVKINSYSTKGEFMCNQKLKQDYGKLTGHDVMHYKRKMSKSEKMTLIISLVLLLCLISIFILCRG